MTKELAIRIITGDVLGTSEQTQEAVTMAVKALSMSDVPDKNVGGTISRQVAIDELEITSFDDYGDYMRARKLIEQLPPAQPERTCVNCGRTANNGGWYADGRTRCPIEEHYALPKDGFCHLWEKRNIADDDYPERMEE